MLLLLLLVMVVVVVVKVLKFELMHLSCVLCVSVFVRFQLEDVVPPVLLHRQRHACESVLQCRTLLVMSV